MHYLYFFADYPEREKHIFRVDNNIWSPRRLPVSVVLVLSVCTGSPLVNNSL